MHQSLKEAAVSPFADPGREYLNDQPAPAETVHSHLDLMNGEYDADARELQFPSPPASPFTLTRIASDPPKLPELPEPRAFSPVGLEFGAPPAGKADTIARSPLATAEPINAIRHPKPETVTEARRPDTVYTVYNVEDAYGGI